MAYSELNNMKKEKAKCMMRYHCLEKIANLFRLFEVLLVLVVFCWLSTRLPCLVEVWGEYLKKVCALVVSPVFVFLVGNVIVITLFVNSGQLSSKLVSKSKAAEDVYQELVKNSENRCSLYSPGEEVVFQDKQTVWEEKTAPVTQSGSVAKRKPYRRSQSGGIKSEMADRPYSLRRSQTEKCWEKEISDKQAEMMKRMEDQENEMSNEEFQRTIEAFIAKQAKFHLEESMAIVVQKQS